MSKQCLKYCVDSGVPTDLKFSKFDKNLSRIFLNKMSSFLAGHRFWFRQTRQRKNLDVMWHSRISGTWDYSEQGEVHVCERAMSRRTRVYMLFLPYIHMCSSILMCSSIFMCSSIHMCSSINMCSSIHMCYSIHMCSSIHVCSSIHNTYVPLHLYERAMSKWTHVYMPIYIRICAHPCMCAHPCICAPPYVCTRVQW